MSGRAAARASVENEAVRAVIAGAGIQENRGRRQPGARGIPYAYERSPAEPDLPVDPNASESAAAAAHAAGAPEPTPGYRLEDQVGHLMRRAHQRHTAIFQEGLGDCDLTPTQFAALVKIKELGKVTQNLLGRHTAMDPATIQGVVQRL